MKRALTLVTGAILLTLLAACTTVVTDSRLQFSLSDSGTIGYEVDDQGQLTVEGRNLRFRNAAGAYGVTITEYTIGFYDTSGLPLALDGSSQTNSVNLFVPPGIQCDTPDVVYGCAVGAPGWHFAPGAEVVSPQSYQLMPAGVAFAHISAGFPVGWYAEIEFKGFDTLNRTFTTAPYTLAITAPD
jgi:hypothetical protein